MGEAIKALIQAGRTAEDVHQALRNQRVDLVFTAHPTQAMRESVRSKYVRMHRDIKRLHATHMSNADKSELVTGMYASIQAAWCVPRTPSATRIFHMC